MDPKVILDATPEDIGRTYNKTCKSASLRDNLCISTRRNDSRCIAPRMTEKYPLHVENM